MSEPAPPKDAATIVVLRQDEDAFRCFMVRRHGKSGFMAGAHVFPGGRLDVEDRDARFVERCPGVDLPDAARALEEDDGEFAFALFVAAARETFEEADLLHASGRDGRPLPVLEADRAQLNAGALSFIDLLERHDLELSLAGLAATSRWITPTVEKRRYDTRFFLSRVPPGQTGRVDDAEVTDGEWLSPAEAMHAHGSGRISLPPPTLCTLVHLAMFDSVDAAFEDARARPLPIIQPEFALHDGVPTLALPGDALHPEDAPALPLATRVCLRDSRWSLA